MFFLSPSSSDSNGKCLQERDFLCQIMVKIQRMFLPGHIYLFIWNQWRYGYGENSELNLIRPFDNFAPLHICNNKQIEYTTNWWHLPLGQVNIVNFCNKMFIKFIRETLPCTFWSFPFLYQYVFQWLSKLLLTNKRLHNVLWD